MEPTVAVGALAEIHLGDGLATEALPDVDEQGDVNRVPVGQGHLVEHGPADGELARTSRSRTAASAPSRSRRGAAWTTRRADGAGGSVAVAATDRKDGSPLLVTAMVNFELGQRIRYPVTRTFPRIC